MSEEDAFEPIGDWSDPSDYRGALVLLTDLEGRAALQFRDRGAPIHPGRWGFFGGGVEPGETLLDAVVRELEEETALRLDEDQFAPYVRVLADGSRGQLFIFRCVADLSAADFRVLEGGGFGLFEPQDWRVLPLVPVARDVLERALIDASGGAPR